MTTCVVTTILLFLPSIFLSGLITDINSPESSLNISKIMQPVLAQETPSENTTNSEPITDAGPVQTVKSGDQGPIADAGPVQTVKSGDQLQLDGTQSYDPDCQNGNDKWCTKGLEYEWEPPYDGPETKDCQDSDVAKAKPSFTAPSVLETTELTFKLWVKDDFQWSDPDSVTITVEPAIADPSRDQVPVADAGQDQTVGVGQQVYLDGTQSRPEGALNSIDWKQTGGPHVKLSDAHVLQPTFSAPSVDKSKKLTFELVVYVMQVRAHQTL